MTARSFEPDHVGYACVSHTSHTHDAGRVRRVTCDTRIRLLGERTISQLLSMSHRLSVVGPNREWTLLAMGYFTAIDRACVNRLAVYHKMCTISPPASFSLYMSTTKRTCVLSFSPGVLLLYAADRSHVASDLASELVPVPRHHDTIKREFHDSIVEMIMREFPGGFTVAEVWQTMSHHSRNMIMHQVSEIASRIRNVKSRHDGHVAGYPHTTPNSHTYLSRIWLREKALHNIDRHQSPGLECTSSDPPTLSLPPKPVPQAHNSYG